jgi:hypothetical protein
MNVHRVRRLLTFDAGDCARYRIGVLTPGSVLSQEKRRRRGTSGRIRGGRAACDT